MTAEYEELRRRLPQEVSSLKLQIEAADAIEALEAENKKLREALRDCAEDLEAEIKARYGHPDIHPAMLPGFNADLKPVRKANELLGVLGNEQEYARKLLGGREDG